jgi:hypothetical protein
MLPREAVMNNGGEAQIWDYGDMTCKRNVYEVADEQSIRVRSQV